MRTRRLNRTEHTTGIPLSPKPKGFVVMTPKNVIPSIDDTPFIEEIFEIKSALKLELVSRTEHEALWNQLVKSYHYLGYNKTISPRVKYLVRFKERPIAAIAFTQASYKSWACGIPLLAGVKTNANGIYPMF